MLFRPATQADTDEVAGWIAESPIATVSESQFLGNLATGQYRLSWTWVAEDDGRIVACAIWWGLPDRGYPLALDCLVASRSAPDRVGLAAGLLDAAHQEFRARGCRDLPAYHLFLPIGWRDEPEVVSALSWRTQAAARAGLGNQLERLRYEWTPSCGVPARPGRFTFLPEPDDEVFLAAFRRVAVGSLDATTVTGVAALGADRQAREEMAIYLEMPGDRDWWRLAYTADGQLAGLAIPSRNDLGPVVGYLGVVPELRGHGYADDLLAEITRFLAARGAEQIRADTDLGNRPMAAAFERAGYRNFAIRLVLSGPVGRS
jgi:GNAT superfamily N-acetyltransferase